MADTVTDHAAESRSLLGQAEHQGLTTGELVVAAQVHATLAVAAAIQDLRSALFEVAGDCDAPIVESLARIARGGA